MLMGRKTFDSIGRALPGRKSLVVTSGDYQNQDNLFYFKSIPAALEFAETHYENELFIIGGAKIYLQTFSLVDRIYLTQVETQVKADAFFPDIDWTAWKVLEEIKHPKDDKNEMAWTYKILERK